MTSRIRPEPRRGAPGRSAVRLDGERSRERILDAAERLLAERGYSGTGIAAISRASGLPASSIYWFFRSKQDLTAAVVERAAERWLDAFGEPPAVEAGDPATLRRFLERALAQAGSKLPDFLRLQLLLALERGEADPEMLGRLRHIRERARRIVSTAIAASLPGDAPAARRVAAELAPLAMGLAEGALVARAVEPGGIDTGRLAEDLEVAVRAIAERRLGRRRS